MTNSDDFIGVPFTYHSGNEIKVVGLTKREYFAIHSKLDANEYEFNEGGVKLVLEREIDFTTLSPIDTIKLAIEVEAKIRVMKADALIAELNK